MVSSGEESHPQLRNLGHISNQQQVNQAEAPSWALLSRPRAAPGQMWRAGMREGSAQSPPVLLASPRCRRMQAAPGRGWTALVLRRCWNDLQTLKAGILSNITQQRLQLSSAQKQMCSRLLLTPRPGWASATPSHREAPTQRPMQGLQPTTRSTVGRPCLDRTCTPATPAALGGPLHLGASRAGDRCGQ